MRPVLPAANRPHPNYTVDPANDLSLQNALSRLLHNAQEEAMVDSQIRYLKQLAITNNYDIKITATARTANLKNYSKDSYARFDEIRDDIAGILAEPNDEPSRVVKKLCFLEELNKLYAGIRADNSGRIDLYKNAHHDLINTLGYYCSYCGIPVGISVHVEHKLPKVSYPNRAVLWDNLLLACNSCNSSKGEKPSRLTGAANANPVYQFPRPPLLQALPGGTENQIANGSLASYIWADDPNFTCLNAFSFRLMRVQYSPHGFGGTLTRTAAAPIDPSQLEIWVKNGNIQRMPPYTGKVIIGQFASPMNTWEVELHVTAVNSGNPQVMLAAQTMINELHLNRDQNDLREPFTSDLRVPLRTDTWFKAISGIFRLRRAYLRDRGQFGPGYQDLEDVIIESAVTSGFWFVWVKVINTYINDSDHLRLKLLDRFFDQAIFPGTSRPAYM